MTVSPQQKLIPQTTRTTAAPLTAVVTSPAPRDVWRELIKADGDALVFQTPEWLDSICANGGYKDASRLYELPGGRRLIMPMVRRRGLPAILATQASLPSSWGMGGLLAEGPLHPEDVRAVFEDLTRSLVLRTTIRPNPLHDVAWSAAALPGMIRKPRMAHVLDLEGGFDEVWSNRFKGTARTAVRKAEKSGLVVECDTTGRLVPVFYDLLHQSVDRWAEQQNEPRALAHLRAQQRDPQRKFEILAKTLGEACRIWVAWVNGEPAATILVLQDKNVNYTRGAMNKDLAGPTQANYLLHRLAIEEACNAGCRYYHMGESGTSDSLSHFKSRFGAEEFHYSQYIIERLPLTRLDTGLRTIVKRLINFKDA